MRSTTAETASRPNYLAASSGMSANNNQPPTSSSTGGNNTNNNTGPVPFSPRQQNNQQQNLGMDDLKDFCGPLGSFKTGLTPRNGAFGSTGFTPSGYTPRLMTGLTPKGFDFNPKMESVFNTPKNRNDYHNPQQGHHPNNGNNKLSLTEPLPLPKHENPNPLSHNELGSMHPLMYEYMQRSNPSAMQQQHQHHQSTGPPPAHLQHHHHHQQHNVMAHQMATSQQQENMSMDPAGGEKQEELDARRRMKNRERVRKCRKRKQDRLSYLESRNTELEQENERIRSSKSFKSSPGTDNGHVDEAMMSSQLATIERLKKSINAGFSVVESSAHNIWLKNACIVRGCTGLKNVGLNNILLHEKAASSVFSSYKIKVVDICRDGLAPSKVKVTWEIEMSVAEKAPTDMKTLAPFHQLSEYISGEKIRFKQISYISFSGDKIAEDIQIIDSLALLSGILGKNRKHGPPVVSAITQVIASSCQN